MPLIPDAHSIPDAHYWLSPWVDCDDTAMKMGEQLFVRVYFSYSGNTALSFLWFHLLRKDLAS